MAILSCPRDHHPSHAAFILPNCVSLQESVSLLFAFQLKAGRALPASHCHFSVAWANDQLADHQTCWRQCACLTGSCPCDHDSLSCHFHPAKFRIIPEECFPALCVPAEGCTRSSANDCHPLLHERRVNWLTRFARCQCTHLIHTHLCGHHSSFALLLELLFAQCSCLETLFATVPRLHA